jgi:tricorn protease
MIDPRRLMSACLVCSLSLSAAADSAYIRQPDLHGDRIVFCAEADLWTASIDGGDIRRITSHAGSEMAPAFSPDGEMIAFSASYDGNHDVYVISARGGEPRRLTWHPGGDEVIGWIPDGSAVLFRSRRTDPMGSQHMYTVDLEGGDPVELPLGWVARLAIDGDTGLWAFTRNNRENRPWKRYRGGMASDIWVGDPERADFRKVTEFSGTDQFPMWHDGRIWFLSDQGGTYNIWSILPDGSDRVQHTEFDTWDIRWPAMSDAGSIVFTLAADLHIFDPGSGEVTRVGIDLDSDVILTRSRYPDAGQSMTEYAITPEGDRLAVVARGEIFSVPVEEGVTLPVTRGTGARERSVTFDPKGERILYVTDEPGEEEVRAIDAWGRGEPSVVSPASEGIWHYQPLFSADGKWIAFADDSYGLFVMPAAGGEAAEIDRGTEGELRSYTWSPGGRWLAYGKTLPNGFRSIFLYDTREKQVHAVTGSYTQDFSPAWDPEGRYLYFASSREINPLIGQLDFNNVEMKNTKLYLVLLREDVENPLLDRAGLPPEEEEEAEEEAAEEDGEDDEESVESIEIDLEGLSDRVLELPVPMGNYVGLSATSTHLFYLGMPVQGLVEAGDFFTPGILSNKLFFFDLKEKEASVFTENISGFTLASGGDKIAIQKPAGLFVVSSAAAPGPALAKGAVDLSEVVVELDPRQEWAQIFSESWRQMREFYWDEGMSGIDWEGIRDQYSTLLPRLASRADLSDLLGQVFGEMNTSHTYVMGGGDSGVTVSRVPTGLLGADLVREGEHSYRIAKIYRGAAPDRVRSPLTVPGVDIAEGEYILAVNRRPIDAGRPFHALLENLAGKKVILTVNSEPKMEGAREVAITPMRSDGDLRYADWVRVNREYVLEKTDGKIGYIHLPNMLNEGLIEFNTWFYPQLDKEGMVVDVRWNGGGSYSQVMLERFRRKVLSYSFLRGGATGPYPARVLNGPFVVLANHRSGSDGDIFPQAVQLEGLAPIIGTRTWGGVFGIAALRPLVDGGLITQSQAAWWDPRDGWGLENRGVIPDIEVPTLPQEIAVGIDRQLDRGIEEVLRLHQENPPVAPEFPPSVRRGRDAYRKELDR